ncbi:hypothetical protein AWB77_02114 [Caballeronia fortuita]|uniref:Uncharacterized protein n=1 Tax=Caballeronia fortuita TaxID=1777138 RepID=A0A158AW53_9BURK|nr:hypothetical protein AWB77_02114 [Caballeronia fortuita]
MLVEQPDGFDVRGPAFATDNEAVDDLLLEIFYGSTRLQTDPHARMSRLKAVQARNEPVGEEACRRPQHYLGDRCPFREFFAMRLQLREDLVGNLLEALSLGGQTDTARVTYEERFAQPFFQLPYLMAYGTVSDVKLSCCRRDIQVTSCGVEGAKCIEGWQSAHLARVSI